MERKIRVERLYYLGDYKNIKICDEVSGLPESFIEDSEKTAKLYTILFATCDLGYYIYEQLYKEHSQKSTLADRTNSIKFLNDLIDTSTKELNTVFKNGHLDATIEEGNE